MDETIEVVAWAELRRLPAGHGRVRGAVPRHHPVTPSPGCAGVTGSSRARPACCGRWPRRWTRCERASRRSGRWFADDWADLRAGVTVAAADLSATDDRVAAAVDTAGGLRWRSRPRCPSTCPRPTVAGPSARTTPRSARGTVASPRSATPSTSASGRSTRSEPGFDSCPTAASRSCWWFRLAGDHVAIRGNAVACHQVEDALAGYAAGCTALSVAVVSRWRGRAAAAYLVRLNAHALAARGLGDLVGEGAVVFDEIADFCEASRCGWRGWSSSSARR